MPDRRLLVLLVLMACGFACHAAAQDVPVLRLTLDEAQMRARETSHRLAEARARESVAQATVTVREAADRPIIAAVGGYTRTNHVLPFTVPGGPLGLPRVLYPDDSTSMNALPATISVEANTRSPTDFSDGVDSPVRACWSIIAIPSLTIPSTGTTSPVLTTIRSPFCSRSSGVSISTPSR